MEAEETRAPDTETPPTPAGWSAAESALLACVGLCGAFALAQLVGLLQRA